MKFSKSSQSGLGKAGWMSALVLAFVLSLNGIARAEGYSTSAPGGMEVEWQSVPSSAGSVSKAWVRDDLILCETDSHSLVAIRRADGFHLWQCDLAKPLAFAPSVSRTNVLVDVDNYLIAIDKRGGNIRWKLPLDFIVSSEPMLIDPPLYPPDYTYQWQNLETIYVAGWDSRMHAYWTRGKLTTLIKGLRKDEDVIAPAFDLSKQWLKANKNGALTTFPAKMRDNVLYYSADNNYIYAVTSEGEEQEPYYMMGAACTDITTTAGSLFVGSRDTYVYCLDRLLMKKKWSYAPGKMARGTIFADEPQTPLVYVPLDDGSIQALRVIPSRAARKGEFETAERVAEFWKSSADGTITAGPKYVYFGSGKVGDHAFKSVSAVDKETGKTVWTESSAGQYLEYPNNWSNKNSTARIYAVTSDGRVVSYKEKKRETGIEIAKLPTEAEPEQPKVVKPAVKKDTESGVDPAKPDAAKPDDKKPEEAKPDAAKPDAAKPDEKKPDAAKPDAAKPEEKK